MVNEAQLNMKIGNHKLSLISSTHYLKLFYRSALFLIAAAVYVIGRISGEKEPFGEIEEAHWLLNMIWIVYAVEMVLRFFPSKTESMGSQRQFARNYRPTGETDPEMPPWQRTFCAAAAWFALNGAIGGLYFAGVIDRDILILISFAYGVCDMICILFFCPFQTWILKNRCCSVCRIYNWDYAMMFTPFVYIPNPYSLSLLAMSLVLLARWEITLHLYPERFSDRTNASVQCRNCKEKLCQHKQQLHSFWEKNRDIIKWH